ncbi:hypothetical protein ACRAWF_46470 [Streptomyces sp. L7]
MDLHRSVPEGSGVGVPGRHRNRNSAENDHGFPGRDIVELWEDDDWREYIPTGGTSSVLDFYDLVDAASGDEFASDATPDRGRGPRLGTGGQTYPRAVGRRAPQRGRVLPGPRNGQVHDPLP